ncbi:MAG: glycosyltransferase [Lachnospiraceae bacterium]|nr:glycosyltransferase [Lachnospiraceae bacterium]
MSDMIKYSVIVPIYNAEKTLNQCLESFAVQLRDDIEILLVNDGSMDKSEGICKSYCEQYPNFRYFYKENGGVSAARNLGLDYAKGEYILFADSDDYVSDKLFETLDEKMREKPDF